MPQHRSPVPRARSPWLTPTWPRAPQEATARLLQIPGGVLDVLKSKSAQGKVTQPAVVTVDALRPAAKPQYARPAQGGAS